MTSPPRSRTASIAAGRMFTSMPSDTVSPAGTEVCTTTTSGGSGPLRRLGTRDSRDGKYRSPPRPRMPTPTNGVSSSTPSRSGTPSWALSMNSRYSGSARSRTASARAGAAKLPPATIRGRPGRPDRTASRCLSEITRIDGSSHAPHASGLSAGGQQRAAVPDVPGPRGPHDGERLLDGALQRPGGVDRCRFGPGRRLGAHGGGDLGVRVGGAAAAGPVAHPGGGDRRGRGAAQGRQARVLAFGDGGEQLPVLLGRPRRVQDDRLAEAEQPRGALGQLAVGAPAPLRGVDAGAVRGGGRLLGRDARELLADAVAADQRAAEPVGQGAGQRRLPGAGKPAHQ